MVRIYKDKAGEFLVQTTCLDVEGFLGDLAESLHKLDGPDRDLAILGVLQNAFPIAFKLAGYKAETVSEQRTLICGKASPNDADVVVTSGR